MGAINHYADVFYLNLILAVAVGYGIGEVISISANRKRGTKLSVIAAFCVITGYLINSIPPWGSFFSPFNATHFVLDIASVAIGIYIAVSRLR